MADGSRSFNFPRPQRSMLRPGEPEKARPQDKRAKSRTHHTQVLPEQLSRAFADARDKAGVDGENPPTFHEIRSWAVRCCRKLGGRYNRCRR